MRFNVMQYDEAISNLELAKQQLEPDGHDCSICGDSGHQAFECWRNPLYAMLLCDRIAKQSRDLHETLHYLAGFRTSMGEPIGPQKVIMPDG